MMCLYRSRPSRAKSPDFNILLKSYNITFPNSNPTVSSPHQPASVFKPRLGRY